MKPRTLNITLAVLILAFTTNTSFLGAVRTDNYTPPDSIPSGWRKFDAYGKFSFYLPPSMRKTGVIGIENLHSEYTNGRMQVSFDYEPFGFLAYEQRAIEFGRDFKEMELLVDGKKSFLFLYESRDRNNRRTHNASLYVGDLPNRQVLMSMLVTSRSPNVGEVAKTIFSTIKFSTPSANKS